MNHKHVHDLNGAIANHRSAVERHKLAASALVIAALAGTSEELREEYAKLRALIIADETLPDERVAAAVRADAIAVTIREVRDANKAAEHKARSEHGTATKLLEETAKELDEARRRIAASLPETV